ncbi:MAG: hypothetical protein ACK5HT_02285 [Draconibacterium sp.]
MRQLRKTLLSAFLAIISFVTFAQNSSFVGVVSDETNNQPLEYANVVVYSSADSSMVSGDVTNSAGNCKLPVETANAAGRRFALPGS